MQWDEAEKRKVPLADSWWKFFGFSLLGTLTNTDDGSIHGAIYVYDHYDSYQKTPHLGKPPHCVIAFRGTMRTLNTFKSDLKHDSRCFFNTLNQGRRFDNAIKDIKNVLNNHNFETESVWLAGHSLGAGIALLAGKTLARSGSLLQTHAFNPPHLALPLEYLIHSEILKSRVRKVRSFFKTKFASVFDLEIHEEDPITRAWIPNLYVNRKDPICSEYTGDFTHKNYRQMISLRTLAFGRRTPSSPSDFPGEPIQFLSSADMMISKSVMGGFRTHHGLKQWWKPLEENWDIKRIRPAI
ncbi:unnamed protein product [Eruca vesicaria subsp. sativa]|uniref:Fungal lipase-type domain-containing protein n=1 Tax=Eruca vesicaria subsp. sativa TaxID=29727 RepID=A0ABC8JXH4_ERUVS|nr:unnamed protein product [Eruca vesicaria subsp. sativa]